jgi:hypothetical protein
VGLFTRKDKSDPESVKRPRALLAAAMPLEGVNGRAAWNASSGDAGWQNQAWYFYDSVGELWFAFNWLASAVSRATLYAAEIDPDTGLVTGPTEDARAQAVAAQILGGADDRPQLQSTMALHWQVSGETYILILPQGAGTPDRWLTLSRRGMKIQGTTWSYKDPLTGVWTKLVEGTDRVIRIWSPHPAEQTHAHSAMRPAIPILTEIEKASQNIIARLDSRLAGNGLYFLPQEMDFATADGEEASTQTLMDQLTNASEMSISEPGHASAHVPIFVQVPGEYVEAAANGHVDLATAMDGEVAGTREAALTRLGRTLEMSREIAMGQMSESNHWTGWQIEESTYKIHLEPFLLKFGMALVKEYYRPALAAMGETNPDRFVLAWDITEVVARPDDTENDKYMWEQRLVSDDYLRSKMGVPDDAIPNDEEVFLRRLEDAVKIAPTLAADAQVARKLFGFELAPAAAGVSAAEVNEPALEPGAPEGNVRALPVRQEQPPEPDAGLVAAAELVVFDALSRAGGRLLTPTYRGQFRSTPRHELHTVINTGPDLDKLMEGSFQFAGNVADAFGREPDLFRRQLQAYVRSRLSLGTAHDRGRMTQYLDMAP